MKYLFVKCQKIMKMPVKNVATQNNVFRMLHLTNQECYTFSNLRRWKQ